MKNIIIFKFFAIVMLLAVVACNDDFLERTPYGSVSSETMWTTEGLTEMGVSGVYQALTLSRGGLESHTRRELYQLDGYGYTSLQRDPQPLVTGSITPSDGLFSNVWKELYEGVHRASDAINKIQTKSPVSEEKKAQYIAECRFLRAYFYFRLNQHFRGVPVYLEPIEDDDATRGQETEAKVWEIIIQELTECINEVNLPNKYPAGDGNYGRVTKGAAYALRGKAYMYIGDWAHAIADFKSVKDCGYGLFQGDYKALFKEANEQCEEMIFSIQYLPQEGYGTSIHMFCGTRSTHQQCQGHYLVPPSLVELYEFADGRPFNWNEIIPGYNEMPTDEREVYFLRDTVNLYKEPKATKDFVRKTFKQKATKLNMSLYLMDGNEARIKTAYEGRDPRLAANVITPYSEYLGREIDGQDRTFTYRWPLAVETELPPTLDLRSNTPTYYYYFHRKFVAEGSKETPNRFYGPVDFPLIRYADVLLMCAEAINEQGFSEEAVNMVNQIRNRAGVAPLQTTDPSLPTYVNNQSDMRERIRNERRREFPNEGIDYFDELRWKTWDKTVFQNGNGSKQIWGSVVTKFVYAGDHLYTWPVPASEIEKNRNLQPTPGWLY